MSRLVSDDTWAILTIWQEARGESFEGKLAVAEVIWNRMRQQYQSDGTVVGTVLKPYQFSGWNTTDKNRLIAAKLDDLDPAVKDCMKAWFDAKAGSNTVRGALLYFNPSLVKDVPTWAGSAVAKKVAEVGRHVFYVPTI